MDRLGIYKDQEKEKLEAPGGCCQHQTPQQS
jgi:hypothetical protein